MLSQCPEYVAPHGSSEAVFGTNPIAVGVPTAQGPLVMDMSTAASSWFGLVEAKLAGADSDGSARVTCYFGEKQCVSQHIFCFSRRARPAMPPVALTVMYPGVAGWMQRWQVWLLSSCAWSQRSGLWQYIVWLELVEGCGVP